MNYEDQLKNLLEQIRREREEEESLPKLDPPTFDNPHDLISFLRNRPVAKHVETTTLSSFLRRFRNSLGVTADDVAKALGLEPQDLKNLESNDCLPWTVSTQSTAVILSSYRVHADALKFLVHNSYEIARVSRRVSNSGDVAQVISVWISGVRTTLKAYGEESLLS
jgi:transcriptional regulator with XRE-family HTH domain